MPTPLPYKFSSMLLGRQTFIKTFKAEKKPQLLKEIQKGISDKVDRPDSGGEVGAILVHHLQEEIFKTGESLFRRKEVWWAGVLKRKAGGK